MKKLHLLVIAFGVFLTTVVAKGDTTYPNSFPTAWVPSTNQVERTILVPAIDSKVVTYAFIIKMKTGHDYLYFQKEGTWVKILEAKNIKVVSLGNSQYQIKANGSERVFSYDKDTPTIDRYGGLAVIQQ